LTASNTPPLGRASPSSRDGLVARCLWVASLEPRINALGSFTWLATATMVVGREQLGASRGEGAAAVGRRCKRGKVPVMASRGPHGRLLVEECCCLTERSSSTQPSSRVLGMIEEVDVATFAFAWKALAVVKAF
jgi:hypothetical protein